jgi:hypothetical protein
MVGQAEKLIFERSAYDFAQKYPDQPIPVEQLWRDAGGRMLANSLEQSDETQQMMDARLMLWDQYIHSPGYGSSYLIGWAAAPKLMEKLEADPEEFKKIFKETLQKGNSITAEQFLQTFEIDVNQPEFWNGRLQKLSDQFAKPKTGSTFSIMKEGKLIDTHIQQDREENPLLPEGIEPVHGKFCNKIAVATLTPEPVRNRWDHR